MSVAFACAGALSSARPAAAHDGPEFNQVVWKPGSDAWVLFSNRGLVFPDDEGTGLGLLCTDALGISNSERPDVAIVDDGRVVVASSAGLRSTADRGCSWQAIEPYGKTMTSAMAQGTGEANTLYVATFSSGAGGIQLTRDGGATWSTLLATDDDEFIQELRISSTDPAVLYRAGQRVTSGKTRVHFIAYTTDAGEHWTSHEITLLDAESDIHLLAISPADPLTVLARTTSHVPHQRLLLSADGGASWNAVLETELLHDGIILADGATIWAASDMGLARSSDGGAHFDTFQASLWMSCITEHGGQLWACGKLTPELNGVGVSSDDGASFQARALLRDVTHPVACPQESRSRAICEPRWPDWERELLTLTTRDASGRPLPDAGLDPALSPDAADAGPEAAPPDDDGCRIGANSTPSSNVALCLLALVYLRRRSARATV